MNHSNHSDDCHCQDSGQQHEQNSGAYHHHHHMDVEKTTGTSLLITLGLNLLIPAAQIVGGIYAGSMALISDAVHNLSDFTAILIAYIAFKIGKRRATVTQTFGYRRVEIIAAMINALLLAGAMIFIVYEAANRLLHPQPISGELVVWVAGIGVLGNGLSAWLLYRDSHHSLNIRGAFLHMMGDFFTSVVVMINGMVLIFKPWYWLDPVLSFAIVVYILKNCWTILAEVVHILMNAVPRGLELEEVKEALLQFSEVRNVHYMHLWAISSASIAFSCHVVVEDQQVSNTQLLSGKIRAMLLNRFGIDHPVFQFETDACGSGDILCEMSCNSNRLTPT
ncbi:MAG: cation diffusion facilitator family transporter [Desulfobacterales bacterium]|nr:cation diffusion facilitator family transporter [Desulfobacterales bacterium]MDD4391803.1 cation diffusion facilitator family transporter [Desulfobacterales bacterium]